MISTKSNALPRINDKLSAITKKVEQITELLLQNAQPATKISMTPNNSKQLEHVHK